MARIIDTADLDLAQISGSERDLVYSGMDSACTLDVWHEIRPKVPGVYNFARAMQAPALEMMLRGIRVDRIARDRIVARLKAEINQIQGVLDEFAAEVWGRPLNPSSTKQCAEFFYSALRIPPIYKYDKGTRRVSTDREALETISERYLHARPIVNCVLAIRDRTKQLGTLLSELDADGRMRTSYNIVGTETGRWSSSANAFGTGDNLQNWTDRLRRIFIADPGYKLAYIDLEQAESKVVAARIWLTCGDLTYYRACKSGDLHTSVCKLIWNLGWTDDPKHCKELASAPFYRHFSYRDMSKRGGHAVNYYGQPPTISKHLKIPISVAEDFYRAYHKAFPGLGKWHLATARRLQVDGYLTTPFGLTRYFLGRRNDDATLREAIAFEPQSYVGYALNLGLYRLWKAQAHYPWQILAQVHDAVLVQYPEHLEDQLIPKMLQLVHHSALLSDDEYGSIDLTIPAEAQVGWNWAHEVTERDQEKAAARGLPVPELNKDGLRKWSKGDGGRRRTECSILDRVIS